MSDPKALQSILPHYAAHERPLAWLGHEVWDHLWPWSRHGFQRQRFLQALSVGAAAVVTLVWLLAAGGHIGFGATISWWVGWSVFEVMVRMQSKPYIKEGAWWGRNYRSANLMDMICYVSFKNLLIGALLFLTMRLLGVLEFLHGLPGLKWLYE